MASIPLPVVTAADAISLQIENRCETWLAMCQCPTDVVEGAGKNDDMKANLTAMYNALTAWTTALNTQIGTL